MPSPFPGMDPYLEGYLWPDVHHSLATQIRDQLAPHLRPRYVARIEIQVVVDEAPESEIGIMYPDVEIVRSRGQRPEPPVLAGGGQVAAAVVATPASLTIQYPQTEVRLATVEIYDTAQNQLVTSIEILSPVNKHEPGLTKYRAKWRQLRDAQVHLLEIDLLRRGQRPLADQRIPESRYRVSLVRAGSSKVHLWTLSLQDQLPILPVPLRQPDADVYLDLGLALRTIYERAAYDLSIDYTTTPPPPALTEAEAQWLHALLHPANGRSA
ncbi:MAG TPA: DUF4058 family protein [Caldilineaceae bacterium]|nr:DUF4058 family protein [Caldilineaceae bacterium]